MPGEEGVWVLIFGDLIVFGAFFITFLVYRAQNPDLFRDGQALLNAGYGLVNTVILLTSSLFVAQAVHLYRRERQQQAGILMLVAMGFSIAFLSLKAMEYVEKISAGYTLNSNEFFIFYYMMTGIHALHVVIGTVVLAFLAALCLRKTGGQNGLIAMESGASFWHLVDLLWIIIYPLLYLVS